LSASAGLKRPKVFTQSENAIVKQNQKSLFVISAVILLIAVNIGGMPNKSALAGEVKIMSIC
jgi:hypothetical protein